MCVHLYVSAGERVPLRGLYSVKWGCGWEFSRWTAFPWLIITFKSYNSNPKLKQNLFHVWKNLEKRRFHVLQTKSHKILCNSVLVFFFSATWYLSQRVTLLKSNLDYKLALQCIQRWLKTRSRKGKNRCFRQIFPYSWEQLISLEWIWKGSMQYFQDGPAVTHRWLQNPLKVDL